MKASNIEFRDFMKFCQKTYATNDAFDKRKEAAAKEYQSILDKFKETWDTQEVQDGKLNFLINLKKDVD